MNMILKWMNIFFIATIMFIAGCNNEDSKDNEHSEEPKEEHHEDEASVEAALTEEQIKLMGIESEKLELQNISGYIKVNGEVIINPDQESKVGSIIPGRIKKIYV